MHDRFPPLTGFPATSSPRQATPRLSSSSGSADSRLAARRDPRPRPRAAQTDDSRLLARARAGDAAAFAALYERHAGAAFGLARRIVHSRAAAEDVVQESFLALWRTDSYRDDKGSVRTFLLRIVHNRAIDALRRDRRGDGRLCIDDVPLALLPAGGQTDEEVEHREAAQLLRAGLSALPQSQQRALELVYFGGFTHAEIARRLDEPLGTVKSRVRLGLEKLRAEADGGRPSMAGRSA